ncbi:MAG: HK97 family phage prohead protease [Armatimonadota bacterium]
MATIDGGFDLTVPLAKVWEDEDGEMYFEGVASSTRLDRQHERMTANAINKMAGQVGLDLLPSHQSGPLEELGTVEQAWVDNDQFRVAGRLEQANPRARRLFEKVAAGRRYGLSVGGRVTKAFWRHDPVMGRQVRHIDDVELDHVAVCRAEEAANPDTYLATLAKAAEGVMEEETDEDAMLARVGRAAVHAARALWPFATTEAEGAGDAEARCEITQLRDEVAETLGEVRKALAELEKTAGARGEQTRPGEGRSQAIPGQERCEREQTWRGVV